MVVFPVPISGDLPWFLTGMFLNNASFPFKAGIGMIARTP